MKRTRLERGSVRVGIRAAARRHGGGKLAVGRPSATRQEYVTLRDAVLTRARSRDEIFPEFTGTDPAHIIARSQGGGDYPWNVLWLSRMTHRMQETPFRKGRLVFALGAEVVWWWQGKTWRAPGSVRWAIEVRADKWSPVTATLGEGIIDLRLPTPGEGADAARSESPAQDPDDPRGVRSGGPDPHGPVPSQ